MNTVGLTLTISPEDYEALKDEATKAQKTPEDLSVEVLRAFLLQQQQLAAGRELLRTMPQRAAKRGQQISRTDTARRHDDHLYR